MRPARRARPILVALLALAAWAGPAIPDAVEARRARRAKLAQALGKDYAFLFGQPFTDVLLPPQEATLLYLTGADEPGAAFLLAGADAPALPGGARARLFLRDAPEKVARFFGMRLRPGTKEAEALGVEATVPAPGDGPGFARAVAKLLPQGSRLRVPGYLDGDGVTLRELRTGFVAELARARPDIAVTDVAEEIARLRAVKDALEVDALRRAVSVTLDAFADALGAVRPGGTEAEVHAELLRGVRRRGAWPAYPFVVAAGPNATIPHHFRNDGPMRGGTLLVIDAGAAVDRYAADVTRTLPVSGRFSERQREVYRVVLAAQAAGIAAAKPGATFADVDRAARRVIADAGLGPYFIHATSHHVGLQVHDPGPQTLEPGMTFTVEPGVYIPDEEIGVRIEDVLLVTDDGAEVLSAAFPREPEEIEKLLADR